MTEVKGCEAVRGFALARFNRIDSVQFDSTTTFASTVRYDDDIAAHRALSYRSPNRRRPPTSHLVIQSGLKTRRVGLTNN